MKKWVIIGLVVLLVAAAVLVLPRLLAPSNAAAAFETVAVARGPLAAQIGATGTVRANQTTLLAWQTSGRVGTVSAAVSDQVKAGQVLAELDPGSLSQAIIMAEADLVNARNALEALQESDVARAQAQLKLAQAEQALEDARDDRTSKEYQRASDATIQGLEADYIMSLQQVEDAQNFYDGLASRPEDDPVRAQALSGLSKALSARDRALANLNYAKALPDAGEVAEADASLVLAQANLAEAQREWERLKDGPDPEDIQAAEARVAAAEASLSMKALEAPFAGTVTQVSSKPGDQVTPGTVTFRIDDLSRLLVDVELPEVDINQVQVGQPATLSFDAISGKQYSGQVVEVARVGSVSQGVVDFTVTVELTGADELVRPGMTAAVNIITQQVEDALQVPNRAVRMQNGQRVVYVLDEGIPALVQVELGLTSESYSEVLSGDLAEGDLLILNPPSNLAIQPGRGAGMRMMGR